ncbi:MAG: Gldg family protein [Phormidesmis sp. CAN_BIN44]|nr:Gldg family protein [Phormidesmis sp. CAN_BIN44]
MKTSQPRPALLKYWRTLFWSGPLLTIMGISAGVVSGGWTSIPLGLIISGIVIIGLWVVFLGRGGDARQPQFWSRSTQVSTNALVSTIAIFVILGLLNFLVSRHPTRIDLTEGQLFTLSPESQQVVRELPQAVKVWVFDSQQNSQDRDLLENYQRQNPKFLFEFIDPEANPGLATSFGIKNSGENRDVYIELQSSKRRQFVQSISPQIRLSENRITSGILQLTSDRQSKLYFLQGHGERSLDAGQGAISQAAQALKDKNFIGEPLNLGLTGKVPADAVAVMIVGPVRPMLEAETTALQTYLNQGGNLLVAVDPTIKSGLDNLLNLWGVKLDDRVVINASDRQVRGKGPTAIVIAQYGDHPITKDFRNSNSIYPLARPLEITPVPGVQSTPLLLTDPNSWAESNLKEQPLKLDGSDRPGPIAIGAAFTRQVTPSAQPSPSPSVSPSPQASVSPSGSPSPAPPFAQGTKESRLIVFGNSTFATDGLFSQYLNGDVFVNSVSWLSQQDQQPLSIRPKDLKNRRITLTNEQASVLGFIALVAVPLVGLTSASFVWWRRR